MNIVRSNGYGPCVCLLWCLPSAQNGRFLLCRLWGEALEISPSWSPGIDLNAAPYRSCFKGAFWEEQLSRGLRLLKRTPKVGEMCRPGSVPVSLHPSPTSPFPQGKQKKDPPPSLPLPFPLCPHHITRTLLNIPHRHSKLFSPPHPTPPYPHPFPPSHSLWMACLPASWPAPERDNSQPKSLPVISLLNPGDTFKARPPCRLSDLICTVFFLFLFFLLLTAQIGPWKFIFF